MKNLKFFLKQLIPPILLNKRNDIVWKRVNVSFSECKRQCSGYDSTRLAESCLRSVEKVMQDNSLFERDGIILRSKDYNLGLLSSLLYIKNNELEMSVIDFGGSFGSSFFQNKELLKLDSKKWIIVEQPVYVDVAKKNEIKKTFRFYSSLDEALAGSSANVILLSSVLQYVEKPIELISHIRDKKIKYIVLDRTAFSLSEQAFLTLQEVNLKEIKSSYPCWFLNLKELKDVLAESYKLIYEWRSIDVANVPSQYKGMLFEIKNEK